MVSAFLQRPAARSLNGDTGFQTTLASVFLYFVAAGLGTVMLGPALPLLAERWHLVDAQLGALFLVTFAGEFVGSWVGARRLGVSLLAGAAGTAVGLFILAFAGFGAAHFVLFCIGVGLGAGLTAGNVIVGTLDQVAGEERLEDSSRRSSRSRRLALLNLSWGIGAIACPLWLRSSLVLSHRAVFSFLDGGAGGALFFLGLGAAFLGAAVWIFRSLPRRFYATVSTKEIRERLHWQGIWMFALTFGLYVGVENALAGWLLSYAQRLHPALSAGGASSVAFCFWVCELGGRGVTALVVKRVDERRFYRGCLAAVIAVIGVLVFVPHLRMASIYAVTALAAVGLSPIYPMAVSFLLARTGNHPQVGKVFAGASLGGTILPWLTGVCSTHFADLRVGFAVPGVGAGLILLLARSVQRSSSSQ
ncbi:Permeases of the major facilitator superfamily [Acidisarcina polymorpha]|uniref:Permeases of the major facilitator superfamily n=2 Tax=Acidisarcina polymorpha TaxID=2211140 RepID=A0A2Z5FVZ8_9BACT|nr:Permeases of the major facilitator superfamily [Acidisarcina polymorpha]